MILSCASHYYLQAYDTKVNYAHALGANTLRFRPTEMSSVLLGSQTTISFVTRIPGEMTLCLKRHMISFIKLK